MLLQLVAQETIQSQLFADSCGLNITSVGGYGPVPLRIAWHKRKQEKGQEGVEQKEQQLMMYLRHDTGNPRVYFIVPVPVPVNTVPLRVRVRCLSRVRGGYPKIHGFTRNPQL